MTRHATTPCVVGLVGLIGAGLLGEARADVWEDPSLGHALADADLVVRARAPAGGSSGQPTVCFTVERCLKGRAPGPTVRVGGLHDPTMSQGPVFQPGAQVYLLLVRDGGAFRVPTPTFGRFPIDGDQVRLVALRDTYLRLTLPEQDFVQFCGLHLGRRDERWLARLREHLARGSPQDEGAARTQHYLALEALALAGDADDVRVVARYLDPEGPFQLRVSACRALAGAGGDEAAGRLLRAARDDPEPAVRSTAVRSLGWLDPSPPRLVERLASLLPGGTSEPVRFSGPNDPRLNKWPAPKVALLMVIARRGAAPVKSAVLAVLAEPGVDLEVFSAALRALITLRGDPGLPAQLVQRFRADSEVGAALYNRELCAALEEITGEGLGDDPAGWRRWLEKR